MSTSTSHPIGALFPDLDLPSQGNEEATEAWMPTHEGEPALAFVPLFQSAPTEPINASVSAALAKAREEAFHAGMAAGREAERASREAAAADSLSRIAYSIADARWAADAVAEETAAEMAQLIPEVLALVLPGLAGEITAQAALTFTAGLLPALASEPRIDIRVAAGIAPKLAEQLRDQPTIHLVADPALPEGDVRISWRDGKAEHRNADFRSAIEAMIADILAPSADRSPTSTGTEP